MKITKFDAVASVSTPGDAGGGSSGGGGGGSGATGAAGGDLGGTYPDPTVEGIDGYPIVGGPAAGDGLYFDGTEWIYQPAGGGLSSITDGTTTVSPVTQLDVPLGGVTDDGSGEATLNFLTSVYGEQAKVSTVAASGALQTIDCSLANVFDLTLTDDCTLTITNPPPSNVAGIITIILRQGGTGSYTVTWPAEVVWQAADGTDGGSAPTLFTVVGALDIVELATVDGGTTWGGEDVSSSGGTTSPLTTKGDLWGYSTVDDRVPVGTDGKVLTADSTDALGVSWQTTATIPPGHAHLLNDLFSGNGSQTVFTLSAGALDADSISVFVAGTRSQDWTLSGAFFDTLTFGTAPASGALNIAVDIVAALV